METFDWMHLVNSGRWELSRRFDLRLAVRLYAFSLARRQYSVGGEKELRNLPEGINDVDQAKAYFEAQYLLTKGGG